jgi:hypothetical protein
MRRSQAVRADKGWRLLGFLLCTLGFYPSASLQNDEIECLDRGHPAEGLADKVVSGRSDACR